MSDFQAIVSSIFNEFDRASGHSFPPTNCYRQENGFLIELAVAGYPKAGLKVVHDKARETLTVSYTTPEGLEKAEKGELQRGSSIAQREFVRRWSTAAEYDRYDLEDTSLVDGILSMKLVKRPENPEQKRTVTFD
jgi:HSP20 family molecular chaperone IbpA